KNLSGSDTERIRSYLSERGFSVHGHELGDDNVLGATGKGKVDIKELCLLPGVERVAATQKPYELASRETKAEDTIITIGPVKVGGSRITVIAGPCAVESKEQIMETALRVRESGAVMLRGGAYKPRTSPYAFQGLGIAGLEFMKAAGEATGMPIVTEVVSPELAIAMKDLTDVFQIGARNMQNFELLKKVGSFGKPVLLKRGPSATIEEWLMAAEYLLASGTKDVMLCERGIRTFETYTRNTLDISAIPVIKGLSHLPIIVDPSHATGIREKVSPAALAAIAAGADGLTVEVHPRPDEALSDGPQSLYPEQFEKLMRDIEALAPVVGKELLRTPDVNIKPETPIELTSAQDKFHGDVATFSGERGTFSEQALDRFFGEDEPRQPSANFKAVFDSVLSGKARYGVVPVENSLTGSIHENFDLLIRYPDICIVGELKVRIVQSLLCLPDASIDDIRLVRSHPQSLAQCREFLESHPKWKLEPCNDNGGAALSVATGKDKGVAAIAGEVAARIHGLKVLKAGIETNPLNYTRFFVIAGADRPIDAAFPAAGKPNKSSIVFSVSNEPGSLFACLQVLNESGINLSKLESRPIPGKPWRYLFYLDLSIPDDSSVFDSAMESLKKKTEDFRYLGAYRASL
ncbi:MAG: 3-deoxy-7-phosphoheptulonate synthase, partial [Treponemataceae bacterium]